MNSTKTCAGKATLKIGDSTLEVTGPVITWESADQLPSLVDLSPENYSPIGGALRGRFSLYFESRLEDEDGVEESKDKDLLAKIQKLSRMGTDE